MKDTANSYDVLQNQQHSLYNRHHHQQIADTTSVYVNHQVSSQNHAINAAAAAAGAAQTQQHQQHRAAAAATAAVGQQTHQANLSAALSNQFHQLQSAAHHANTAAFYPHLYPTYQTHAHDQQHMQADALQHEHIPVSSMASSVSAAALSAHLHLQQHQSNNSQNPTPHSMNHWNAASLGHHNVAADPAALAYITSLQNHHTTVADHHRNSTGAMPTQSMAANDNHHAPSNYQIDPLYNSSAAYGYNLHDAAFFRPSNESSLSQTGHHSNADISSFWNHPSQQQSNHSQANQNNIHGRHQISSSSDQPSTYMHDPRQFYFNRASFNNQQQSVQNFGQQAQLQHNHRLQQEANQQRDSVLNQPTQNTMDRLQQSVKTSTQPQLDESFQNDVNQSSNSPQTSIKQQYSIENSLCAPQASKFTQAKQSQKIESNTESVQSQKPFSSPPVKVLDAIVRPSNPSLNNPESGGEKSLDSRKLTTTDVSLKDSPKILKSQADLQNPKSNTHLSNNTKNEPLNRKQFQSNGNQTQNRSFKASNERNVLARNEQVEQTAGLATESTSKSDQKAEKTDSLSDEMNSLNLDSTVNSPKKTTWASIASQPAKISQPKSLKSKMAASNSVLSSAKHLAAVSLETSSFENKNGISASSKTNNVPTVLRGSALPLAASVVSSRLSCKLDFGEGLDSKISWPAMNAAAELKNAVKLKENSIKLNNENSKDVNSNNNECTDINEEYSRIKLDKEGTRSNHNYSDIYSKEFNNRSKKTEQPNERKPWNGQRDRHDYVTRRESENLEGDDQRDFNGRRKPRNIRKNNLNEDHYRDNRLFEKRNIPGRNDSHDRDFYNRGGVRYDSRGDFNQQAYQTPQENNNEQNSYPFEPKGSAIKPCINRDDINPKVLDISTKDTRYFVIKSYSEDDIYRSIKYSIWCSTNHGNKKLDEAFRKQMDKDGLLYLFFSVNSSGRFCGMAQMTSLVDFDSSTGVWAQSKWQGEFSVKWLYVKDVPHSALRYITLENNENKPVTNSRDTQEVPCEKGKLVFEIMHKYPHTSSIFDDFEIYEKKQEMEKNKKSTNYDQGNNFAPQQQHRQDDRRHYNGSSRPYGGGAMRHGSSHNARPLPPRFSS